ncbi:MAG: nucleoside triphosphate pyrophosphohydrolase [Firmicutes bacterium]|nr:nucleoside triphosphate pyrophosphohydrolase [Bacillota bacterium]
MSIDPRNNEAAEKFAKLLDIMDTLRGENGCPWDLEQDHQTLMPYLIEEAYEAIETIEENSDPKRLAEELGDVMLQIVFHSRIGKEKDEFSASDVLDSINAKMIRRHPHIFGDVKVSNSDEVLKNWEEIKLKEKGCAPRKSLMDGIPHRLPALLYARRLQERAGEVGFDWEKIDDVMDKFEEEAEEMREAMKANDKEKVSEELGDLLFALVNVARWLEINPEEALRATSKKFIRRFRKIENTAESSGKMISDLSLDEMEEIWQASKKDEK